MITPLSAMTDPSNLPTLAGHPAQPSMLYGEAAVMDIVTKNLRRRSVRGALLASTGLAALAQLPAAAYAQTTVEETAVELTRRSDTRTLIDITLDAQETTDLLGFTPNLLGIGVDGSFGNDRITLQGDNGISGSVVKTNDFGLFGDVLDLISFFPDINTTTVDVIGVEGGYGSNRLRLDGRMEVDAYARAVQDNLDLQLGFSPGDLIPLTLESSITATVRGLHSTRGRSTTTNSGDLVVISTVEFERTDFAIDRIGLDLSSLLITADSVAIGLSGDRYTDRLSNAAGGTITANAFSDINLARVTLEGVRVIDTTDTAQATSASAALAGGRGNDILTNDGVLNANATSKLVEADLSAVLKDFSLPTDLLPDDGASSLSLAAASGMDGGVGADRLTNNNAINLTAFADHNKVGISLSDGGINENAIVSVFDNTSDKEGDEAVEELSQGAIAEIVGLRGDARNVRGGGADTLINAGDIVGTATADADTVSISVGVPFGGLFDGAAGGAASGVGAARIAADMFGVGFLDYGSDAGAFADGIRGGAGNDTIRNTGTIDVTANSMSNMVGVSVSALDAIPDGTEGPDEPFSVNAAIFNASTNAVSRSNGLSGGLEDDQIQNDATVVTKADADAISTEVALAIAIEDKALQIEVPIVFSRTDATAISNGIDAGSGFDTVNNAGSLSATADAFADSTDVTVGLSLITTGGGVNAAIIDKNINATAIAAGIRDGKGTDAVNNSGEIDATAISNATSTSVGVDVTVNTTKGLSVTSGLAKADQKASSRAFGVERFLDDLDADASFTSTGEIDATATANSTRTAVSVDLAYTNIGASITAPIISTDNIAEADAGALISFEANDVFAGLADMSATAGANATSTGVGVSGAATQVGVSAGISALRSSTTADADATLLSFGTGSDTVANNSILLADADAISRSDDVSVAVGGTMKGLAIGASLIDSTTNAFANATTIASGDDSDVVENDSAALAGEGEEATAQGEIRANALADASSTSVGVAISAVVGTPGNPGIGVGLSAALSRSGLVGDADATAVNLGGGDDRFNNVDIVSSDAVGKAKTEAVNVALGGSMVGAAISGAIADTSVTANADATGAEGAGGGDMLANSGSMTGNAEADANTVGVAVNGSVAAGFAAGAAGLLADTNANAVALGMNGGEGGDEIDNTGTVAIDSNADAANTSVAVNINATPTGLSVGGAIVSARTNATSDAVGLAGDRDGLNEGDETTQDASEDDVLRNLAGVINVTSRAEATSISVGVNGQYNGFGAVALIADTIANSAARGLFGGSGGDTLFNAATITTTSTALGNGPAVAVNPFGANIGDINTSASAFSYGLDGGVGSDVLINNGPLTSTSTSTVTGELVQVTLIGGVVGDLSTAATTSAFGLFGGDGDDGLTNTNVLTSNAMSSVTGTSVAVNLAGASFADVSTVARAAAAGAAGGDGDNTFSIDGVVGATSNANARSTNVSVTLVGAAFGDTADAGTKAFADSYGYLGGIDADSGEISGRTTVTSTATARNDAGVASIAGASFAETAPEAMSFASIFSGGEGADSAVHSGNGLASSVANGNGGATSIALIGASSANANPLASATARGLSGDGGSDDLTNNNVLTTFADSNLDVGRYQVSVAGASIGSISSTSNADAAGIDGGADGDLLRNNGTLTSSAFSDLDSDGVNVTLVGAGVDTGDGNLTAAATAAGMLGGAGADNIANTGAIINNARVDGSSGQVNVTLAGAGLADAKSVLSARSVGIDGEDDDDTLSNSGGIISTSTASASNTNTSVVVLGAAGGDTKSDVTATALIFNGGAGRDSISNDGVGVATATAVGASHNVEVTVGGALLGDASSKTTAAVGGVDGGAGADIVQNNNDLDLNASAAGVVGRVSVAVAGADGGSSVETDILASGYGIAGGADKDTLTNDALIDIDVLSATNATSNSVVIIGSSAVNTGAGLFSTSNGVGIKGDEDSDVITNDENGVIDVFSSAFAQADDSSTNIFGAAALNGLMRGRAWGIGLAGGEGADDLFNFGTIKLQATGVADSDGASFTAIGASNAGGDVSGSTNLFGMHGGIGDDLLFNAGALTARSDARGVFRSTSLSAIGFSGGGGAAGADAWTYGFFGDAGFDEIFIGGTATSIADARVTLNSGVDVGIGSASSSRSGIEARAYGRGASGGGDADMIEVTGVLNTYGYAQIGMTNTQFAFIGGSSGSTSATARAEAFAVNGDSGNDMLINNGSILANAESRNTGSGAAGTTFGATNSSSKLAARSNALGLYGGAGEDTLINNGSITANVTTTTKSENTVTSAFLFSNGKANSQGTNNAFGALFFDSQESTTIVNTGDAVLKHFGNRDSALRGTARAFAKSTGVTGSINVNAFAEARAFSNVNLRGVRLGDGSHTVNNSGTIKVESFAFSSGAAVGTGNSSISGDGVAIGRAYVNSSRLTGVESLSGALDFDNSGTLNVLNKPDAASAGTAKATGLDLGRDPDAKATATIEMNNVHAYGVRSGAEADTINNSGNIIVRSQPEADRALARASAFGSFSLSVDAFATAVATVNDAEAYGVHAGDGDNMIINSGVISVVSDPYAEARAEATGRGPDGDVQASATANALRAQAYGIITGSGNDYIENTGSIVVNATPSRSRSTSISVGEFCVIDTPAVIIGGVVIIPAVEVCASGEVDKNKKAGTTSKTETVISTGDGNDTVVNAGVINATGGTAILLGDGDDTLRIEAGSSISGAVSAGAGSDTLELVGAVSYNATAQSFENFSKFGPGVSTVTNLSLRFVVTPPLTFPLPVVSNFLDRNVLVEEGELRFSGLANLTNSARVTTYIYGDGRLGQLSSTSTMTLDGGLTVIANSGAPYIDGAVYDVVRGSTRVGEFDAVALPADTALRSFTGAYTSTGYRVTADVSTIAPLVTAATATELSFAQALDGATPIAEGEVARTVAALQKLSGAEDVNQALQAITPKLSTTNIQIAEDTLVTSEAAAQQRLASFRAVKTGRMAQPSIGFDFAEGKTTDGGATVWAASIGGANVVSTFSNRLSSDVYGMARGVDFQTESGALLGFSVTQLQSNGSQHDLVNSAAFTSMNATLYGAAPLGDKGYATAALSWGGTDVVSSEPALGLGPARQSDFGRASSAFGVSLEAGRAFNDAPGAPEVFGALNYTTTSGSANAVNRVAAVGVNVEQGQSEQLESEFGVRMIRDVKMNGIAFRPHLALSWVRRYGDGESVTANFSDMPGYSFRLSGDLDNRDGLRAKAGVSLLSGKAFELSASGVAEIGDKKNDAMAEVRAVIKF